MPTRLSITPRESAQMVSGELYRTVGSELLASQPYIMQYTTGDRYNRQTSYGNDPAKFLYRSSSGKYFIQYQFRNSPYPKDEIKPLTLAKAINWFDILPEKLLPFDSAFPLETLTRSERAVARAAQPVEAREFKYDAAVSFAGPNRSDAEAIARIARDLGYSIFYDDWYADELWGTDLVERFDAVYRKESRYCVMFVSAEYRDRMWTIHERRSAIARALQERGEEYILPIRVDDTELPGVSPTIRYVSLSKHSVEQIADMLVRKLARKTTAD